MSVTINKITNANMYMDGVTLLGLVQEADLPDAAVKMLDHQALGMAAMRQIPSGLEAMEATIRWNCHDLRTARKIMNPFRTANLQLRASLEVYGPAGRTEEQPVVVYLNGTFKNIPAGNYKQMENVELESRFNVTYIKIEMNGEQVLEVDVDANIWKVAGEDILARYRTNLGA